MSSVKYIAIAALILFGVILALVGILSVTHDTPVRSVIAEGDKGVEQVSKLPTREEAIGQVVALILAPGQRLGGILKGQAGKVAALIKAVEEKAKAKEGAAPAEPATAPQAPASITSRPTPTFSAGRCSAPRARLTSS